MVEEPAKKLPVELVRELNNLEWLFSTKAHPGKGGWMGWSQTMKRPSEQIVSVLQKYGIDAHVMIADDVYNVYVPFSELPGLAENGVRFAREQLASLNRKGSSELSDKFNRAEVASLNALKWEFFPKDDKWKVEAGWLGVSEKNSAHLQPMLQRHGVNASVVYRQIHVPHSDLKILADNGVQFAREELTPKAKRESAVRAK